MSCSNEKAEEQMPKMDTIKLRNKYIGKSCKLFYPTDPLKIIRGEGTYMYDEQGTKYLDCINNVAHVGHCHPKVTEAGCSQMKLLSTNNRFLHDELVKCAEKIISKMPGDLTVCYFVNSGSEANDLALQLARKHTKQVDVITVDHAYHGHLTSVMEISPYKFNQPGGDKKQDYVHVASCPDTYRGRYNKFQHNDRDLGQLYADEVENIINNINSKGKGIAAFICESLQSCGGQIIPPNGYLDKIYKLVRNANGVVIADEVQVGFGRSGTHYWAFETQNVVPDIITIAKPMGNGHPVGAVVTTEKIANSFAASGISYFNTYGGNPVSCAIANAVMDVVDNEKLQENALIVGNYLLKKLTELKNELKIIGDVRGCGLFVGIELMKDNEKPATSEANWIVNRMKNVHHTLISSDGPNENVIKLKPPMVFTCKNADEFLAGFKECLETLKSIENTSDLSTSKIPSSTVTTTTNEISSCNLLASSIIPKDNFIISIKSV